MSEPTFTPGPWHPTATPGGWDGVREPEGMLICALSLNNPANMMLIAAAPSLYDALDHVEAMMSIVQPRGHTNEYLETLGEVRAALALARGETK